MIENKNYLCKPYYISNIFHRAGDMLYYFRMRLNWQLFILFFICSEASDWEAKFYQIQSKYLLLLNELHNPQVGVSASRQEMVSQLLKDVIEAAETRSGPLASIKNDTENGISKSKNVSYDRFGFRIDTGTSTDSMEEKVEKLRKQAETQHQNQTAEKEEIAQVCIIRNTL